VLLPEGIRFDELRRDFLQTRKVNGREAGLLRMRLPCHRMIVKAENFIFINLLIWSSAEPHSMTIPALIKVLAS